MPSRWLVPALALAATIAGGALAQPAMTPTAPKKMTSPGQKQKMQACEERAARLKIALDQRAKFLMDCMEEK